MIITGLLLFYFLVIQFVGLNAKESISKSMSYFVLFVSLILLNLVRLYGQSYFPDIPEYNYIFEKIKPLSFVLIGPDVKMCINKPMESQVMSDYNCTVSYDNGIKSGYYSVNHDNICDVHPYYIDHHVY